MTEPGDRREQPVRRAPHGVRAAAVVVAVEAAVAFVFGVIQLADIDEQHPSVALTTMSFFVLYGAGLGWCAWGFARLRSWSRGPIVLAQLLQLGLAWSFLGGSSWWIAVGLGVPAVAVALIAVSPSTTSALYGTTGEGDSQESSDGRR